MAVKHRNGHTPPARPAAPPARPAAPPTLEAPPANMPIPVQSLVANDETVRTRAYHLWEAAGCPDGDGVNFWFDAEREVNGR